MFCFYLIFNFLETKRYNIAKLALLQENVLFFFTKEERFLILAQNPEFYYKSITFCEGSSGKSGWEKNNLLYNGNHGYEGFLEFNIDII